MMIKEGKFGLNEAVCMTVLLIITKIFYTTPNIIVRLMGTAVWYATLISCSVSIIMFLLIYWLMKRFEGKNLVEIFHIVFGKIVGKILSLVFSGYFLYYAGLHLREFIEILKAYTYPYTPTSLLVIAFTAVAALLVFLGFEVISRLSYASFFIVIGGMVILLSLAYTHYNPNYLTPYLGYGLKTTFHHGLLRCSAYDEVIILAFLINSLQGIKNFKKAGLYSLMLSGVIFSTTLALYIMALQYTVGSENLSGIFQLARIVYLSRFLQRVESLFLFIWVISSVLAVSIAFYMSVSTYCKSFNIRNHKPLVLPFSILLFILVFMPKNLTEVVEIHMFIIREYSFSIVYSIPILALIVSLIFKKKRGRVKNEKA